MKKRFLIGLALILCLVLLSGCVNRFPYIDDDDRNSADQSSNSSETTTPENSADWRYTLDIPEGMTQTAEESYSDESGNVLINVQKTGGDLLFTLYTKDTLQYMLQAALDSELGEGVGSIEVMEFERILIDDYETIQSVYVYDFQEFLMYQMAYAISVDTSTIYTFNFIAMSEAAFIEWRETFTECAESIRFVA